MTKVPDYVTFGIDEERKSITYGYVRSISDENRLIELLRLRLLVFFIEQTQVLQNSGCAFPLATMTCVGIETLGTIFVTDNKDDTSFQFVEILKKTDQVFGRKPNKKFYIQLQTIWSEKDLTKLDSYGKLTYRFFRNTMLHGYQAKGVYLSYEDTGTISIVNDLGYLKINPNWFWDSFKKYYTMAFDTARNGEANNTYRSNCLRYIQEYLLA